MRGLVFLGDRRVAVAEFDDPVAGPGEVVVGIRASGICGSDLNLYRKADPRADVVCGHEPCGVVVEVGPGVTERQARVGQRVMIHHYRGCGACWLCQMGYRQMCAQAQVMGTDLHGGNAPFLLAPVETLVELPEELSFAEGAAISCGTGTAYAALRRLQVGGGETLAIFGQGPVGLSATQLAVAMGARVIALDVSPERQALAREFGADAVIDARANDPVEAIRALTHGEGAHKTLDTSGAAEARAAAVRAARTWGTACYVGERGQVTLDVSPDLLRRQITLVGSWTFSTQGQADCAEFVADHGIAVDRLFTHRWRLDQAEEAYRLFDTQSTGKGVILPA